MPTTVNSTVATFTDDTVVMAVGETVESLTTISHEQSHYLDKKRQIKLNRSKSEHIDFTNKKIRQQPIFVTGSQVPYVNTAKYLGMILGAKLWWKEHIKKKVMSSTSSSGKCIGCLDAILGCQSTVNSYYTRKLYVQFGVMVSSFWATPVIIVISGSRRLQIASLS
jgi:hypothetical protein